MEEVNKNPPTSGMFSPDDLANWNASLAACYAGTHDPEKCSGYAGWMSAPSDWNMMHRLDLAAISLGLKIEFSNIMSEGWVFKKTKFSYRVSGLNSRVDAFIKWIKSIT